MVRITGIATEQLASDFNSLLIYFRGYWETIKLFVSNIVNNKSNSKRNFSRVQYAFMGKNNL